MGRSLCEEPARSPYRAWLCPNAEKTWLKHPALEVLKTAFQANVTNGDIAAEIGRLALELDHLEIAKPALEVAEQQGVHDWKTLSAQGTLRAKEGQHGQAQRYYLAALDLQPDALSVINNLALSYTLDGEADKAEELLRKTISSGHDDNRIRQNLALVLGLQGKFSEARQYASADMSEASVKANIAYLRNMVSSSTQLAAAKPEKPYDDASSADEWQPFASNRTGNEAPVQMVAAKPEVAKVQMVRPVDEVEKSASPRAAAAKPGEKTGSNPARLRAFSKPISSDLASLLRVKTQHSRFFTLLERFWVQIHALWYDQRGVSAVEFAILVPVLALMYIGTVEIANLLTVMRRVETVASTAADLNAQVRQVSTTDLADIFAASTSILTPYQCPTGS